MMMKANEAYELTVKVLTEDADSHLKKIEEAVKKACGKGQFYVNYYNGVADLDREAKLILLEKLTEAGYHYAWHSPALEISWEKK
jgi:hypothetical protein